MNLKEVVKNIRDWNDNIKNSDSWKRIQKILIAIAVVLILIQVVKMNIVYTDNLSNHGNFGFALAKEIGGNQIEITVTPILHGTYEDCEVEVSVGYYYEYKNYMTGQSFGRDLMYAKERVKMQLDETGHAKKVVNAKDIGLSEKPAGKCSIKVLKGIVKYKK